MAFLTSQGVGYGNNSEFVSINAPPVPELIPAKPRQNTPIARSAPISVYGAADKTDITKLAIPRANAITYNTNGVILLWATHSFIVQALTEWSYKAVAVFSVARLRFSQLERSYEKAFLLNGPAMCTRKVFVRTMREHKE